jgi:hypothetical protein
MEIGFNIGLCSGCYLKSCDTVKNFFAFQEPIKNYFPNIGVKNIKNLYKNNFNLYVGNLIDKEFENHVSSNFDLIFINQKSNDDKYKLYLDTCWNFMEENGIIVCDFMNEGNKNEILNSFCYYNNADSINLITRYGVSIIFK